MDTQVEAEVTNGRKVTYGMKTRENCIDGRQLRTLENQEEGGTLSGTLSF